MQQASEETEFIGTYEFRGHWQWKVSEDTSKWVSLLPPKDKCIGCDYIMNLCFLAPVLRFCHQNILVTYKKDLNGVQRSFVGAEGRVADKLDVAAHMRPHVKVLDGDIVPFDIWIQWSSLMNVFFTLLLRNTLLGQRVEWYYCKPASQAVVFQNINKSY